MVAADDVSQVSEADTFGLPDAGWTTIERRLDAIRPASAGGSYTGCTPNVACGVRLFLSSIVHTVEKKIHCHY